MTKTMLTLHVNGERQRLGLGRDDDLGKARTQPVRQCLARGARDLDVAEDVEDRDANARRDLEERQIAPEAAQLDVVGLVHLDALSMAS